MCEITTTQDRRGVWWHTNFVARLEGLLYSDRRCLPSSHFVGSCCKDKFCPHPKPNLGGRMNPFLTCKKSMPHFVKALQSLVNTVVVDYSKLWFKQTDDLEWYCLLCKAYTTVAQDSVPSFSQFDFQELHEQRDVSYSEHIHKVCL